MMEKTTLISMPIHMSQKEHTQVHFNFSIKQTFCNVYEYLFEHHPRLFMVFLIVGIPVGMVAFLMIISLLVISPFAFLLGW